MIRNHDLDLDPWFLHRSGQRLAKLQELRDQTLSRSIYFRPSNSPVVHVGDSDQGSCFRDWWIPTASYLLDPDQDRVHVQQMHSTVDLDTYVHRLLDRIRHNIRQVYSTQSQVNLCYSGGVDSMVILAAIIEQGFLHQTNIVTFDNLTQTDSSCVHLDPQQTAARAAVLADLAGHALSIRHVEIDSDAVIRSAHTLDTLRCYVTHCLLQQYPEHCWLFGFHGNQLLLHKDIFAAEILRRAPNQRQHLSRLTAADDLYTTSLAQQAWSQSLIPLSRRYLMVKPWHTLSDRVITPLATAELFDLCRSLDFAGISLEHIAKATVARELMEKFGQGWLLSYITHESVHDIDNLESIKVPVQDLDLAVPDLVHDAEGLTWIQHEIHTAQTTGLMPINSLVSVKNLQWIDQHTK